MTESTDSAESALEPSAGGVAESRTVALGYLEAFATSDPEIIASFVAEDFVNEHTAALGSGCIGRDAYKDRLPGFLKDMVDLEYQVDDLVIDDDRVAVFYTMTARWQAETAISIQGVQRLEVRNGLIARRTDYWDSANFLVQVSADAREALGAFGIT